MTSSLAATWQQLGSPRLLVLGDYLLDRVTWGNAERISPEAPVLVLRTDRRETHPSGAGSVCTMLRALDAEVVALGAVGKDDAGEELRRRLIEAGVDTTALRQREHTSTPVADRLIGRAAMRHAHQILRVDSTRGSRNTWLLPDGFDAQLSEALEQCQALLISDHGCGACAPEFVRAAIDAARPRGVPVLCDPGETADYEVYRGVTLLTPNRRQAQTASGVEIRSPKSALLAGVLLCDRFRLEAVAIKLDREGLAVVTADGLEQHFPTAPREVYDVTGARDMVLAMFGLCLAGGLGCEQSAPLVNLAAGLKVEKIGAAGVTRYEIQDALAQQDTAVAGKLVTLEQMSGLAEAYRLRGRRVVFTNGCFDLLHAGHVTYLQQAAALGDVLVVGINSDTSVRAIKGPQRPIYDQQVRSALLGALDCVDHVLIFDDATPHSLLWAIRPDVLVKGGTYTPDEVVGREVVQAYGGQICVAGMVPGVSTTAIVGAVRQRGQACRTG